MREVSVTVTLNAQELRWLKMTIAKATDAMIVEWAEGLSWLARLEAAKLAALDRDTGRPARGVTQ